MRVVFATAELQGVVSVGGLAAAAAGLVHELRAQGVTVDVVMPDYGHYPLENEHGWDLIVPGWAGPASVRVGRHPVVGDLHLVSVPGIHRPHPYNHADGSGWADNDQRFLAFSMAVASLWRGDPADVLHLNDWHTAAALADLHPDTPSVISIHNLAYQGTTTGDWLTRIGPRRGPYEWWGSCNPLKGGLTLADAIIAVSPTYATEIQHPAMGCGHDGLLSWRRDSLFGIRNGIDVVTWNPAGDAFLPEQYDETSVTTGKAAAADALAERLGLDGAERGPLTVMVTRLTEQKGTDLVPELVPFLRRVPMRLAILGSGDAHTAGRLHDAAAANPGTVAFVDGYDEGLSHLLFGAGDLFLMPSRFEPCGLTQMQAMRYGTLPVATDVGGLHDTIADADDDPDRATGVLAAGVSPAALVDALHRAGRAWSDPVRRHAMAHRGMTTDWSWTVPAREHLLVYQRVIDQR